MGRKSFGNKKASPTKKPVQEPAAKKPVQESTTRKSLQEAATKKSIQESPVPIPAPVAEVSKPTPAPVPVSTKATPKSTKASTSPAYKTKATAKKTPQISMFSCLNIIYIYFFFKYMSYIIFYICL